MPFASMTPQIPGDTQAAPCICQTTFWLADPSTDAVNVCDAPGASVTLWGCTLTRTWLITVTCEVADCVGSAALVASTVTGLGEGIAPGPT